jgi:hypothetical protein
VPLPARYGLQTLVIPSAGTYGLATDAWIFPQAFGAVKPVLFGSVALPGEEQALEKQP